MRSTARSTISRQRKIWRGHELATKEDIARLELGTKGEFGKFAAEIEGDYPADKAGPVNLVRIAIDSAELS
jgi:hypothetical protein